MIPFLAVAIIAVFVFSVISSATKRQRAQDAQKPPAEQVFKPITVKPVSGDDRYPTVTPAQTAPTPRPAENHRHPAVASARKERAYTGGSMAAEYAASPNKEGCDDTRDVRYVRTEALRVEGVTSIEVNRQQVLQGVIWSQILGSRGGRRAVR